MERDRDKTRAWVSFFNIVPFSGINSFDDLPFLKPENAHKVFGMGVATFLAIILHFISILPDPWTKRFLVAYNKDVSYFIAPIILALLTFAMLYKQYSYYYSDELLGKQGIFKKSIKQVNPRERSIDILLALFGASLFPMTLLPIFWFLMLSFYSFLVILRCFFTLRRPIYAKKLKGEEEPIDRWYYEALEKLHNNVYTVKLVLGGWIVTHSLVLCYSFSVFLLLYWSFLHLVVIAGILIFMGVVGGLLYLYFGLIKRSYSWGAKVCTWMGV